MSPHVLFYIYMIPMLGVIGSAPYLDAPKGPRNGWSADIALGTGINADTPLRVRQSGYPDITVKAAHYHEKSFQEAPLYTYRFSKWKDNRATEVQLLHHKLILQNPPPGIDYFNVSHGYNFLTLNRAYLLENGMEWRYGGGIVISHPETRIRGKWKSDDPGFINLPPVVRGFYISGVAAMVGGGRRFYISEKTYTKLELQLYAGWARVPVADGNADVPNVALLATWGIGFDL